MNILGNNASRLNAIVFENRNKNYGAYEIRESYGNSLKKSLFFLIIFLFVLFGSAYLFNKSVNSVITDNGLLFDDPIIDDRLYVEKQITLTPLAHENNTPENAAAKGGVATRIKDEAIVTSTNTNQNLIHGVGSETATGVSATSTIESTVSITAPIKHTLPEIELVVIADEMPEFEGGMKGLMDFVSKNVVYPQLAKESELQGVVYVSFIVNENGVVEGAKVLKGIGLGCDEEVLRVVNKMPRWKKPGKNQGRAVRVRYNIPVSFKLK